jgi:hypothetical protein
MKITLFNKIKKICRNLKEENKKYVTWDCEIEKLFIEKIELFKTMKGIDLYNNFVQESRLDNIALTKEILMANNEIQWEAGSNNNVFVSKKNFDTSFSYTAADYIKLGKNETYKFMLHLCRDLDYKEQKIELLLVRINEETGKMKSKMRLITILFEVNYNGKKAKIKNFTLPTTDFEQNKIYIKILDNLLQECIEVFEEKIDNFRKKIEKISTL